MYLPGTKTEKLHQFAFYRDHALGNFRILFFSCESLQNVHLYGGSIRRVNIGFCWFSIQFWNVLPRREDVFWSKLQLRFVFLDHSNECVSSYTLLQRGMVHSSRPVCFEFLIGVLLHSLFICDQWLVAVWVVGWPTSMTDCNHKYYCDPCCEEMVLQVGNDWVLTKPCIGCPVCRHKAGGLPLLYCMLYSMPYSIVPITWFTSCGMNDKDLNPSHSLATTDKIHPLSEADDLISGITVLNYNNFVSVYLCIILHLSL